MKVTKLQQEKRKGAGKAEGRYQKAGAVAKAGKKKKQKENHVWSLGFFKAVVDYEACQTDISQLNEYSCVYTGRMIAENKVI